MAGRDDVGLLSPSPSGRGWTSWIVIVREPSDGADADGLM